ncbi:MAG TPA: FKBP-type peptidyl-prolyl cis-trans isomerase [Syntrophales bacterium]|nr:FKBP-type peptidyl-prolyl cis-trans isomerase [Syntrophales bacterium]
MILALVLSIFFIVALAYGEDTLKDKVDRVSYALGLDIGSDLNQQSIEVNTDILMKGIKDALSGGKRLLSDDEIRETMATFTKELVEKEAEDRRKLVDRNKKDGMAFLAENKKKEGVKTLASGLQYKVISEGNGKSPKATDTVTLNYRGTLINGYEFDSSYRRGVPSTLLVNGAISGWTEALQLMKVGAKWQLFIPSNLAYGEEGTGNMIGPNASLIFEVELISIKQMH